MKNEFEVWEILVRFDNWYFPFIKHYFNVVIIQTEEPFTEENALETCAKEHRKLKGYFVKSIKKL